MKERKVENLVSYTEDYSKAWEYKEKNKYEFSFLNKNSKLKTIKLDEEMKDWVLKNEKELKFILCSLYKAIRCVQLEQVLEKK